MKKKANLGTAIWITNDDKVLQSENHLPDLISRSFDLEAFKKEFNSFIRDRYITEDELKELLTDPAFNPGEPGAPKVMTDEQLHEFMYIDDLSPLQVGEFSAIIRNLNNSGAEDAAEYLMYLVHKMSVPGFEEVLFGNVQPYHFAFKQGDIRIRLFSSVLGVEMDASRLNDYTAGKIIDAFFSLVGGDPKNVPSRFVIDLINFSGKEPKTRSYEYHSMDDFFQALSDLTRRRVAKTIDRLLKFAKVFYQRVYSN